MRSTILYRTLALLLPVLFMGACTEPYALQTNTFEDALVVEATITNELKNQEIKISRTFRFEDSEPVMESGANVYISDEAGTNYEFVESDGKYVSEIPFQAIPGKLYRLSITTNDGKTYNSTSETLTTINEMQDVQAELTTQDGQRGIQINVSSFDASNTSKYYRYEYDETYKIIAPKWANQKAILIPPVSQGAHSTIALVPKDPDTQICYGTQSSKDILLYSTAGLSEDRVDYPVRFISADNYIISHRYSIMVRQYIQNLAAYTFYKTLKEISGSGGTLSQNQPGFFYGNLKCIDNPDEKVIGFFDISSVSSRRIFFNYTDFFPGEQLPPYYVDCGNVRFNYCFNPMDPLCNGAQLIIAVRYNTLLYYTGSDPSYTFVPPPCADCTTFASNIIPPFWE